MKRYLLALVSTAMCWAIMMAVPAKPEPFAHIQSDGSTVNLVMRGGEFSHSLMTLDGLTVARSANGDYCYMVGGSLSDMPAHNQGNRSIEEHAFIIAYRNQMTLGSNIKRTPNCSDENTSPQVPTIGSPRIPIILVNYSDVKFIDDNPVATFENQFNEKQYSCLHYFQDQSYGQFSPRFDILGPVNLPHDRAFYGENVYRNGLEFDKQLGTMVYDACQGIASNVNFSDYDNDGNGYVDVVVVLFAGVGESNAYQAVPESVWSCQWGMQEAYDWGCSNSGPFWLDGVTIDKFAVFNELNGDNNNSTTIDGVGGFCHEFSHCLGLPKFYPTNNSNCYGMGHWDIMSNGCYLDNSNRPAGYTSYERHFMGWMNPIDPVKNARYVLTPLNSNVGSAVKVTNDANPNEYYLLEYRVKTGWDAYLPADGIMIIHVDYDPNAWYDNTINNVSTHPRMTLIPADNNLSNASEENDLWPHGEKDSLTNYSTPPAAVFTGGFMNKPIKSMSIDCESKLASFWYMKESDESIQASAIALDKTNLSLFDNLTAQINATVYPGDATNKAVIWKSSNTTVATVNSNGFVTAKTAGTAKITATTTDGSNLSASCDVNVYIIPATSVTLNKTSLKLDVNETYQLTATINPTNATYQTVAWTSSNPNVATVSSSGLVTPVAPGNATITATTTDGTNLSASCQVTVIREVKSITLNTSNLSLILPETAQLTATISPSDATYPTLNWTSSNTSVATVDGNGLITSKGVGTTTIKATTTDGTNLSASCQVTVSKQYVTSITLNETNLVMHIGETVQLIADVQPENASNPTVNWSSGNTSVARVDNNGLVTAVAGGTTYIRASAADGSNRKATCTIEVLYDYYLKLDTLSHIRGTAAQVVDLPVTLVNKNPISGIQFDVSLPDGVTFNLVDGLPDVWLDDARGTRSHSISASQLSNGKYRVLVTSSTSKNLKGNDGVLVHMNMLLPQLHNTGNSYINISNIIASEADETRHTLNNTSSKVSLYYIVGDADANASVDIADHAATASKILGKSPSPFYYDAANVDANYSLDVVDLVGITNIALEIKPITIRQVPRSGHLENRLYCDKLRLNESGEAIITLGADCDFDFAGFQMDVSLPPGLTLVEATLNDEASKLGLATETLPESGVTRLLATSFSDVDVSGACPKLLTLKVKAERDYISSGSVNIGFDNIIFAERNLTSHYFDAGSIEYIEPSGVHELMDKARIYVKDGNIVVDTPVAGMVQIVATDGRMVEHTAHIGHNVYAFEGSGIYIVNFNGKTIKVKL